jgi:hypothetical protein
MAAWQVEFSVVPRRALAAAGIAALRPTTDAGPWSAESLPSGYQGKLAAVASPASPSSADVQSWGPEDGNRIAVAFLAGRAAQVTARVDVRRLDARFGAMLLQFARTASAVLVRSDGLVVEPIVGAFAASLRSSSAGRFANDPGARVASYLEPEADEEE